MSTARERLIANLNGRTIPGLDGLRGILALSVVAYHNWSGRFPGAMAVEVFFVISGLLISWLLLKEEQKFCWVDRKSFYIRRGVRLFPALSLLLLWELLTDFPHVPRAGLIAAALYSANYRLAAGGHLAGLGQAWSLAVEEHFYLIWPHILVSVRNRRLLMNCCFIIAATEVVWRIVSYRYVGYMYAVFATETSSFAVLSGCGLALLLWNFPSRLPEIALRPFAGAISLAAIVLLAQLPERPQWVWGKPAAVPFASIVVLQAMTYGWRILENPLSRFLGRISYGIYLWGTVAGAFIRWFGHSLKHTLLFAAAIALATLSHYLVEQPIQSLFRRRLARRQVPAALYTTGAR
jgi:peptidoglycan/LPS O-acetylase OafA/YrhL